jgi:hypothetical protein
MNAARTAMIAMTTSNSMIVKALFRIFCPRTYSRLDL